MVFGIQTNRPRISDDVFRMVLFDVLEASLDKHDGYLEAHLINLYFLKRVRLMCKQCQPNGVAQMAGINLFVYRRLRS